MKYLILDNDAREIYATMRELYEVSKKNKDLLQQFVDWAKDKPEFSQFKSLIPKAKVEPLPLKRAHKQIIFDAEIDSPLAMDSERYSDESLEAPKSKRQKILPAKKNEKNKK